MGSGSLSVRSLNVSEKKRSYRLSPNFTLGEFQSKDGADTVLVDDKLLLGLEYLRMAIGHRAIRINSGYRTIRHNASIGGVTGSEHTTGHAADISVNGYDPINLALHAHNAGFRSVGLYRTFVHVGTRGNNQSRFLGAGVPFFAWEDQGHGNAEPNPATDIPESGEILPLAAKLPTWLGKLVSLSPMFSLVAGAGGIIYMIKR